MEKPCRNTGGICRSNHSFSDRIRVQQYELKARLNGKLIILLLFASAILPGDLAAQWTMGSRNIAMGEAHTALVGDDWAVFHNPAMIQPDDLTIGVFAIRYFGLKEIQDHAAVFSLPLGSIIPVKPLQNALSAGIHTYGFELYRETNIRLGWSVSLSRVQTGVVVNYTHLRIEGYGSRGHPVINTGLGIHATSQLTAGVRVSNLLLTEIGNSQAGVFPAEIAGGISWDTHHRLVLSADIVKDVLFPVSLRTGFEAEPITGFFLRGGWISDPFIWTAGTGIELSGFLINMAVQQHHVLGLSPGFDFRFTI